MDNHHYASPACAPIMRRFGSREVCLCIHGFCSAPGTFLHLTEQIRSAGYDMCAPLLSGHGTRPEDMLDVTAEQWVADACGVMEQLLGEYDRIHLLGHSMGGALCTYLAGRYAATGRVGKVMLLVPGYALRNKSFYEMDYESCGDVSFPLVKSAGLPPELAKGAFLYDFMYQKSIGQLIRLGAVCQAEAEKITAPVWMLYTNADPVVDPAVCAAVALHLQNLVLCQAYEKSGHNLMTDCEWEDVHRRIEEFLNA